MRRPCLCVSARLLARKLVGNRFRAANESLCRCNTDVGRGRPPHEAALLCGPSVTCRCQCALARRACCLVVPASPARRSHDGQMRGEEVALTGVVT
jgi:hypothetical protein